MSLLFVFTWHSFPHSEHCFNAPPQHVPCNNVINVPATGIGCKAPVVVFLHSVVKYLLENARHTESPILFSSLYTENSCGLILRGFKRRQIWNSSGKSWLFQM